MARFHSGAMRHFAYNGLEVTRCYKCRAHVWAEIIQSSCDFYPSQRPDPETELAAHTDSLTRPKRNCLHLQSASSSVIWRIASDEQMAWEEGHQSRKETRGNPNLISGRNETRLGTRLNLFYTRSHAALLTRHASGIRRLPNSRDKSGAPGLSDKWKPGIAKGNHTAISCVSSENGKRHSYSSPIKERLTIMGIPINCKTIFVGLQVKVNLLVRYSNYPYIRMHLFNKWRL